MKNLDGSPPVTPMFIAVVNGMAATHHGHLIVDSAEAWTGSRYQLVRVPAGTQGVRLGETVEPGNDPVPWWEHEDAT